MKPSNIFLKFRKRDIEQAISERFEQQVSRYPQRLAVKTGAQAFTYEELNRTANRIAHAVLVHCDEQTSDPILLFLTQGFALISAMLAVLKAGKASVSVDVSLPPTKANQILNKVRPPLILTDHVHFHLARELFGEHSGILDITELGADYSVENPRFFVSPDSIAYIHFTSGSTGDPKGVVWNHRNELFGIRAKTNRLRISADDRISLVRSNNVGATRDVFLALLNGACLVCFDLQEQGLAHLGTWLLDENVTVFSCVATIFRQAIQTVHPTTIFSSVRLIHIGGEPVFKSDFESYKKHFSDHCIFVTRYSISETQAVSYYFIDKQTEIKEERVPVGFPLEGNEILLLDEDGNKLGFHQKGEIAVKSPYLAMGYWQDRELTDTKFLPDPSGGNARTYLTGDLGYMLPDGCLVHTGRKDLQTKIRGHRVEVSEIEVVLHDISDIAQAVVVPSDDPFHGGRLVAYIVPKQLEAFKIDELRATLKKRLQNYMLPNAFVVLDSLPLMPNGKVDRRALALLKYSRHTASEAFTSANTALEKVLVKLWSEIVGVDHVTIHDNFEELGGDSLTAAQIISQINSVFPLKQPLNSLFNAPTIAELTTFILANETYHGQSETIATTFMKIDSMSQEEISESLKEKRGKSGNV
jgi:amino acid adenylation domain-containing protein